MSYKFDGTPSAWSRYGNSSPPTAPSEYTQSSSQNSHYDRRPLPAMENRFYESQSNYYQAQQQQQAFQSQSPPHSPPTPQSYNEYDQNQMFRGEPQPVIMASSPLPAKPVSASSQIHPAILAKNIFCAPNNKPTECNGAVNNMVGTLDRKSVV